MLPKGPFENPVPLMKPGTPPTCFGVVLKLKIVAQLVWWSGTKYRMPKMTSTPAMCHQTLTSFRSATSLIPNVFMMP